MINSIEVKKTSNNNELRFCVESGICYRVQLPISIGRIVAETAYKFQKTEWYLNSMQGLQHCRTEDIKQATLSPTSNKAIQAVIPLIVPPETIVVEPDRVAQYLKVKKTLHKAVVVGKGSVRILSQFARRLRH